jgi:hypothetical protein
VIGFAIPTARLPTPHSTLFLSGRDVRLPSDFIRSAEGKTRENAIADF